MEIQIPYGKGVLTANADTVRTAGIIRSGLDSYMAVKGEKELIEDAVKTPIDSRLWRNWQEAGTKWLS